MTFRKCNKNSLERRAGAIRQTGRETHYRSEDCNVYHVPLWSTSENARSQIRHEIPTYHNYTRLDHNGVPTRHNNESVRWTHVRHFIVAVYDSNIVDGDLTETLVCQAASLHRRYVRSLLSIKLSLDLWGTLLIIAASEVRWLGAWRF